MRIVGPAIGGALIGVAGVGAAFVLQAVAYLFSSFATSRIRARGEPGERQSASVLQSVGDGLRYARAHPDVRLLLFMSALPSILVYPYVSFIPVFAQDVLHSGSTGYGFLASAVGYGSIVGAVLAANFSGVRKRGQILVWTTFIYMALVTLFALSSVYALSFGLLVVAGIANSVYLMFNQVMIQLIVDDDYRGRVLSLYVMVERHHALRRVPHGRADRGLRAADHGRLLHRPGGGDRAVDRHRQPAAARDLTCDARPSGVLVYASVTAFGLP